MLKAYCLICQESDRNFGYPLKINGTDLSHELKYPTLREPRRGTGTLLYALRACYANGNANGVKAEVNFN